MSRDARAGHPSLEPSPERLARTKMTAFMRLASERWNVAIPDYESLYALSIDRPDDFWRPCGTSAAIIGEMGERTIENRDRMPGARFFPDARLNFAENLLRRRDDARAIVFNGEGRQRRTITHAELWRQVATFAAALRAAGIRPAIASAGYLPNMPEAIVAALGAASIGAVWSSCSPDFGVQGVLDRFGQIEPRVLVAADGYFYGGKTHDFRAAGRRGAARSCRRSSGSSSFRTSRRHRRSTAFANASLWSAVHRGARADARASSGCRSTIRSTSCIRPARPACPSASSTAPAAR